MPIKPPFLLGLCFRQCLKQCLWIVFSTCLTVSISCADAIVIDAEQQYGYAEKLYEEQQYRRAADEFDRFTHFFPDHPDRRMAGFKAGTSLFKAGDSDTALRRFNQLTQVDPPDDIAIESFFMMTECHLFRREHGRAILQMHNLIALSDHPQVKDRALARMGWIHIDQMEWEEARSAFRRMSAAARADTRLGRLDSGLEQASRIPRKSPSLAGTLSVIPGAGQLYTERYEDALLAFLVNGALMWAAYESFDQDFNALGGLLSFVGLGFYASNIYGAVSGAHKYNLRQKQRYADQLRLDYLDGLPSAPLPQGRSGDRFVLAFRIPF